MFLIEHEPLPLALTYLNYHQQKVFLEKAQETKLAQALYGLSRTLVNNMITGVSVGFNKRLQIAGVGYRPN